MKFAALFLCSCLTVCATGRSQTAISVPFICEWANTPGGCPSGNFQLSANCGPDSVLMIADKYSGATPMASDLDLMATWLQAQYSTSGYQANPPFGSGTNTIELAGLASQYFSLPNSKSFSNWTLSQLQSELQNGYPVVVYVETFMMTHATYDGHYMVLLGMDSQNVVVNDPGRQFGGKVTYPLSNFIAAWGMHNNSGVSIHGIPPAANQWTWSGGTSTTGVPSTHGNLGVASTGNTPGGRDAGVSWVDSNGNLWLFGGETLSGGTPDYNDLWKFNPSQGQWAWMSGSSSTGAAGVYGSKGVASPANAPAARGEGASGWVDASNNLWLFGGYGDNGDLGDLWEYSSASQQWTWQAGSSSPGSKAVYGAQGVAASANDPGARDGAASWIDSNGSLWLFGGFSTNDLWQFSPASKLWTWVGGSNVTSAKGTYGTRGIPSTANIPGARGGSITWTDKNGNFWLFGGGGFDSTGGNGFLNDLWEFIPSARTWTWVSGSNVAGRSGTYGSQGIAAAANAPGGRVSGASWVDGSGNLWLFGGDGRDVTASTIGGLNDLWRFTPSSGWWTWMGGSTTIGSSNCQIPGVFCSPSGTYGTLGTSGAGNTPGGRIVGGAWVDANGYFWLYGGAGAGAGGYGELSDLWRYVP